MQIGRLHIGYSWWAFRRAQFTLSVEPWPRVMRERGWDLTVGCFQWYAYLALLAGCVHAVPPSSADRQAIDAVLTAWHAAGLSAPGDCLDRVEVRRHDTLASYVDACDGLHPGLYAERARHSAGCLTHALRGVMGRRTPVIEIAPGYHDDMGLVQHEAIHALRLCAYGDADAAHSDARLWAVGGAESVQARHAAQSFEESSVLNLRHRLHWSVAMLVSSLTVLTDSYVFVTRESHELFSGLGRFALPMPLIAPHERLPLVLPDRSARLRRRRKA